MTISKAPLMLRKSIAIDFPLLRASLILEIKQETRSIIERLGRALKWVLAAIWCYMVSWAILLARSRLRPLPKQLSRAISRQELMSIRSYFLTLGIITIRDFLNAFG